MPGRPGRPSSGLTRWSCLPASRRSFPACGLLASWRRGRCILSLVHWMNVLVPYLAGAGSTLAVDFLIQVYVKPRTEGRSRRDERWERDVLDLGSLMAGEVST